VCPYFELHGTWIEGRRQKSGPITTDVLDKIGLTTKEITWNIAVANIKSFDYTFEEGDRIEAALQLRGNDTTRHTLEGRVTAERETSAGAEEQIHSFSAPCRSREPSREFPGDPHPLLRAAGTHVRPDESRERIAQADSRLADNVEWRGLNLPGERLILNPKSKWATYVLERSKLGPFGGTDNRHTPWNMFATLLVGPDAASAEHHAMGLVDDCSDGF
jgi:hypothetical protein